MPLDIELFISEVEKRPALYDPTLKDYSDKNIKEQLWLELCEIFVDDWTDLTPLEKKDRSKELQDRWKNLRTCFRREYEIQKKVVQHKKGSSIGKKRRQYIHFEQLLFLLHSIKHKDSNNDQSLIGDTNNDIKNEKRLVTSASTKHASKLVNFQKKLISKSNRETSLETQRDNPKEDSEIDEDKYFLLSLLPSFRKFNEDQKFIARIEIMNTMRRIRLSENLHEYSSHSMHESAASFSMLPSESWINNFSNFSPNQQTTPTTSNPPCDVIATKTEIQWEDCISDNSSS